MTEIRMLANGRVMVDDGTLSCVAEQIDGKIYYTGQLSPFTRAGLPEMIADTFADCQDRRYGVESKLDVAAIVAAERKYQEGAERVRKAMDKDVK